MKNEVDKIYNQMIDAAHLAINRPTKVYEELEKWLIPNPWYRRLLCKIGLHKWMSWYDPVKISRSELHATFLACAYCARKKT